MSSKRFYLQTINPLSGLDEYRLAAYLADAERGSYAGVQWLFRYIEKRNPTVRAVKRRLKSAVGKLQWDIVTTDCGGDAEKQAMAERQAATLRAAYDKVRNLRVALTFLALADLRGYAHLEKIYRRDGSKDAWDIIELRPVEQWYWVRDGYHGRWEYNGEARMGIYRGTPIQQDNFIVREVDDPACEIFAKIHVRQEASDSDWDGYLRRFGVPTVLIEGPPNVPQDREAEYQRVAERIASDASGYIPNGSKPHMVAPGTGSSVFAERIGFLDGQIVIAGTAGKLTILTESGSGTLAGNAQADAFDDLAQAVAMEVSEAMVEGFDRPLLERVHPGEEVLAYFEFAAVSQEDGGKALDDASKAYAAGYAIDEAELSEKSGYKLTRLPTNNGIPMQPESQAAPIAPEHSAQISAMPAATPDSPPAAIDEATLRESAASPAATAAVETALRVPAGFVAPAQSVIDALIAAAADGSVSDAEFISAADEILRTLPELAAQADIAGVADALEQAMRTAVATTLQG